MNNKRDVPIVLTGITYEDNYEGEFAERRANHIYSIIHCKPLSVWSCNFWTGITKVQVDQFTDSSANAPKREQRYTVAPDPANVDFDDDFGFNETTSFFTDAKTYNPTTGQDE